MGSAALLVGGLAIGKLETPSRRQLTEVPWWSWLGGLFSVLLNLLRPAGYDAAVSG